MNVTGPLTYRVTNQIIDKFDNGRLACHFFEVIRLFLLVLDNLNVCHIIYDIINVEIDSFVIEGLADIIYIFIQAYDCLGFHLSLPFNVFDNEKVGGTTCRHNEDFVSDRDGHDAVAFYVFKVKLIKNVFVDLFRLDPLKFASVKVCPSYRDIRFMS